MLEISAAVVCDSYKKLPRGVFTDEEAAGPVCVFIQMGPGGSVFVIVLLTKRQVRICEAYFQNM